MESKYFNPALSAVALLLKNALLSSKNVDVFFPIITSPHSTLTISDVSTLLTDWFPRVASVDKHPNMAVALDPLIARVDARISDFLERDSPGSLFLALVIILHGVAHSVRHHFVPIALRGSCLVDDEDQWLSDPGYKVERAFFGGIIGVSFAGSPTDPEIPEISHFTLYTEDGDLYMIDVETADSWIESDKYCPFNLDQLQKQETTKSEVRLQTCAKLNTLCAATSGKMQYNSDDEPPRPPGPHWYFPRRRRDCH
ncbi:hypothetical protein IW261DRAFT_1511822, partial [Armillaria novae-zelandiae]